MSKMTEALEALIALVDGIDQTGGAWAMKVEGSRANLVVPMAGQGFDFAIGEAYLLACKALGEKPKLIVEKL